jgi:hypothetical protein
MKLADTDSGVRPIGSPRNCLYCKEAVGSHQESCVCKSRTVVIQLKTWIVVSVPQSWNRQDIEFFFNESSHCSNNEFRQIVDEINRTQGQCCTCFRTKAKYLREAAQRDHEDTNWVDP